MSSSASGFRSQSSAPSLLLSVSVTPVSLCLHLSPSPPRVSVSPSLSLSLLSLPLGPPFFMAASFKVFALPSGTWSPGFHLPPSISVSPPLLGLCLSAPVSAHPPACPAQPAQIPRRRWQDVHAAVPVSTGPRLLLGLLSTPGPRTCQAAVSHLSPDCWGLPLSPAGCSNQGLGLTGSLVTEWGLPAAEGLVGGVPCLPQELGQGEAAGTTDRSLLLSPQGGVPLDI